MTQFEYVAVLISIIVGLALAQILRGIGRIATDESGPKPYWVHLVLTVYLFFYVTMFWWWEFQLVSSKWSLSLYVVLIVYATLLFFASLVFQPSNLHGIENFKNYYYEKRRIIYGTVIAINFWDIVDTLAKGTVHLADLGPIYVAGTTLNFILAGFAIYTANERYHQLCVILLTGTFTANMIVLFTVIE
ncbi:MAG: hypothetical protein R3307_08550 [Anaerolineales bacterium]|nr:hypothetical protein [Anaerolineales bacterium]